MPSEYVILTNTEPASEKLSARWQEQEPEGIVFEGVGSGFRQFIGADGVSIGTLFRARVINDPFEAACTVEGGTNGFTKWMDYVTPFGDPAEGVDWAHVIAGLVDGVVRERS